MNDLQITTQKKDDDLLSRKKNFYILPFNLLLLTIFTKIPIPPSLFKVRISYSHISTFYM